MTGEQDCSDAAATPALEDLKKFCMAGKEGFEPSVLEYQYAGFRIRCIRPLCHLSAAVFLLEQNFWILA